MTTSAKIIAYSRAPSGSELTTFEVVMPRIILPEITRHRCMSFSVQSSRAVPVAKNIENVRRAPFVPKAFARNIPGMSGGEPVKDQGGAKLAWIDAARSAADHAETMMEKGVAKEHANRILEPYLYVAAVITSSEWENFYALRIHADAQPEIRDLAVMMKAAHEASDPVQLRHGDLHSPYHPDPDISAAICARVSYQTRHGQTWTDDENRALADKLAGSAHWSPFEHQAWATQYFDIGRNLGRGWEQHRDRLDRQREVFA